MLESEIIEMLKEIRNEVNAVREHMHIAPPPPDRTQKLTGGQFVEAGSQSASSPLPTADVAPASLGAKIEVGQITKNEENWEIVVKINQYPNVPGRIDRTDEIIGRVWISDDSHVSLRAQVDTLNAKVVPFVVPGGYGIQDKEELRLSFYFRKSGEGMTRTPYTHYTRKTPKEPVQISLLDAVQNAVENSKTCDTWVPDKEFTAEQIARAEKGEPEVPAKMPDDAQWFLPVPSQTILDFRVVELKGDYWLFWHDDSHANDGMLPGFDEPNFKAKAYLLLEIEHYADPVAKNYWSCGMRSPYKIPKEAIDRNFVSLRYRWMTDPNDYNIMSGHWGEKTLTTDGAGTFEQLLEEGISQEYILSQSIEQFNQIRGVPGTLTYAPNVEEQGLSAKHTGLDSAKPSAPDVFDIDYPDEPEHPTPKVTLGKNNAPVFDIPEGVELTDAQRDEMWEEHTRLIKEKEDAEQKRVMDTARKFPWIFTTNLGSKPIDPILKACDNFEADDWDWDTGYPLTTSLEKALGHGVSEVEASACLDYYNAFCNGDREHPRPVFGVNPQPITEKEVEDVVRRIVREENGG